MQRQPSTTYAQKVKASAPDSNFPRALRMRNLHLLAVDSPSPHKTCQTAAGPLKKFKDHKRNTSTTPPSHAITDCGLEDGRKLRRHLNLRAQIRCNFTGPARRGVEEMLQCAADKGPTCATH